jgi:hypothetical protein
LKEVAYLEISHMMLCAKKELEHLENSVLQNFVFDEVFAPKIKPINLFNSWNFPSEESISSGS